MSEIETLKKRLEDAEAALKFYADKENWIEGDALHNAQIYDDELIIEGREFGGRRAREYFEKWGEN